jgi:hypothetical protein
MQVVASPARADPVAVRSALAALQEAVQLVLAAAVHQGTVQALDPGQAAVDHKAQLSIY